jgi:hypothetical protein
VTTPKKARLVISLSEDMTSIRAMPLHAFGALRGDPNEDESKDNDGHESSQDHPVANVVSHHRSQSSSASRFTAGAFGFLNFSESGERPDR